MLIVAFLSSFALAGSMVPALAAARTLEPGVTVTSRDLLAGQVDPVGLTFAPLGDKAQIVGSVVRERMYRGELIRAERLAGATPTAQVPLGLRAIAVFSAPGAAVGSRVDLVDPGRSCWIEQLVQVLGVQTPDGSVLSSPAATAPEIAGVVVALTPDQGLRFAAAVANGSGLIAKPRRPDEAAPETRRCE